MVWKIFNKFIIRLDVKPIDCEERLNLFVTYLIENKKKSSTVKSYISAIKSTLWENNIKLNKDRFLLNSLIKACKLTNDYVRTRIPIKKDLVRLIIQQFATKYAVQPFLMKLYSAIVASAYFGLFRIGEIALSEHIVKADDVHIGRNKNKLLFILRSSKTHNRGNRPQIIKIASCTANKKKINPRDSSICPFALLKNYISVRPK